MKSDKNSRGNVLSSRDFGDDHVVELDHGPVQHHFVYRLSFRVTLVSSIEVINGSKLDLYYSQQVGDWLLLR